MSNIHTLSIQIRQVYHYCHLLNNGLLTISDTIDRLSILVGNDKFRDIWLKEVAGRLCGVIPSPFRIMTNAFAGDNGSIDGDYLRFTYDTSKYSDLDVTLDEYKELEVYNTLFISSPAIDTYVQTITTKNGRRNLHPTIIDNVMAATGRYPFYEYLYGILLTKNNLDTITAYKTIYPHFTSSMGKTITSIKITPTDNIFYRGLLAGDKSSTKQDDIQAILKSVGEITSPDDYAIIQSILGKYR